MGVVNASQIDRCAPTLDWLTFIQQHASSHRFEIGNHANSIVIAEHSVDRPLNACQNSTNECKCIFKVAERRGTIITSQNAQIIFQSDKYLFKQCYHDYQVCRRRTQARTSGNTEQFASQKEHGLDV